MYWPVGAVREYSIGEHASLAVQIVRSDDHSFAESGSATDNFVIDLPGTPSTKKESSSVLPSNEDYDSPQQEEPSLDTSKEALKGQRDASEGPVLRMASSRNSGFLATITSSSLALWQTKPFLVSAIVMRSQQSLESYGQNCDVSLRPDSAIAVVQATLGYLMIYSVATSPDSKIYTPLFSGHFPNARRRGTSLRSNDVSDPFSGPGEGHGVREINLNFRMVIKVDAGICRALALDDELVIATAEPPAIQRVRWAPDPSRSQARTELLTSMQWISKGASIADMIYDRPMNIATWITTDGKAYAVQRVSATADTGVKSTPGNFSGHCFHSPQNPSMHARKAAINARFSLIAVGCADQSIRVYTAKDYAGHIPLSHKLSAPSSSSECGSISFISYSPDGHCLFVGYEKGWAMWSVYGKPGSTSFSSHRPFSEGHDEPWFSGVADGIWIGGGSQIVLLGHNVDRVWIFDMARSAIAGCFASSNIARSLLQTNAGFMVYCGFELSTPSSMSLEKGQWRNVQIPPSYLANQWPIRCSVISPCGRYVAVAGRRGLAHYSINSGRWKLFTERLVEDSFTVRGGMCWHHHILLAGIESNDGFEIRAYSRDAALDQQVRNGETLPAPIVILAQSGQDSLLAYTYGNILYHYIINVSNSSVSLQQVGQIALNGIIRAPPRVRAISWILPEEQLESGDPSQDVSVATILFLVDGKLVVLRPTTKEDGNLKYDMRIVAQNVEYYVLMRDKRFSDPKGQTNVVSAATRASSQPDIAGYHQNDLNDSLFYFDGNDVQVWTDTLDLLASTSPDLERALPTPVTVPVDFYPLSVMLARGILLGIESDISKNRDAPFSILRFTTRTQLFLPPLLRYHISQYNSPSALYLSHRYTHLPYFPHALELLLHEVLDHEVDSPPKSAEQSLLPTVLEFLSSFPEFLDIVVQCTRKTEVRSWRTLFAHLPPPTQLFEEALSQGNLKTAGGYLLVLHTLEKLDDKNQVVRLLRLALEKCDWELCNELARFLMAKDGTGDTLREVMITVGAGSLQGSTSLGSIPT